MLTLDIAVATLGADGIARTAKMILPPQEGVRYVVSWQTDDLHPAVPDELRRPDVLVSMIRGRGLSRNRNNALRHCTSDIILIADDDLHYTPHAFTDVRTIMTANGQIDFATFRFESPDNKKYPDKQYPLSIGKMPKGYTLTSFEIAMRREVVEAGMRFDTRVGLGTNLSSGEDELFLLDLLHHGFKGEFHPINIAYHEGFTTGYRPISDRRVARAMGAIIGFTYPLTGFLRLPLKAFRMHRSGQYPLLPAVFQLTAGWLRQLAMSRPWHDSRLRLMLPRHTAGTPLLQVAIVTINADGIRRVAAMNLPVVEGVGYVVSWQGDNDGPLPAKLDRPDIHVYRLKEKGISNNRNNAVTRCTAPVILNADDDLRYTSEQLRAVIDIFDKHPEIDFATFRYSGCEGWKSYPETESDLARLPKGYSMGTVELAFRRSVIDRGVRFDTRFGPGARLSTGEDAVMLLTLRRLGLPGRFFPVTVTHHDGLSTGFRPITDKRVANAMGAHIGMEYPLSGFFRLFIKAYRMSKSRQMPLLPALTALTRGWVMQLFMKRPWKQ